MTPIDTLPAWFALPCSVSLFALWLVLVRRDRRRALARPDVDRLE